MSVLEHGRPRPGWPRMDGARAHTAEAWIAGERATPDEPLLTIITVVYNGASTLQASIDSIAAYGSDRIEYLVVDGQSTDGTLALIADNQQHISRWISEVDDGIYDAMRKGIEAATGQHIYFLGADDCLLPGFADLLAAVAQQPAAVHYGDVRLNSSQQRYDGAFDTAKLCLQNICHQAIAYPRTTLQGLTPPIFDPTYRLLADHVLNWRLWGAQIPFAWCDAEVALFEDTGASGTGEAAFTRDSAALIAKHISKRWAWWYRYRMARHALKVKVLG